MSEDLYSGPTVLAPGAPRRPDALARLLFWPLLVVLLLVVLTFYVLFSPLQVVGDSMMPSLLNEDRVLRTKSYTTPHRGDVVIIDAASATDADGVIKRVAAIAGDVIEIRDDVATVNGVREDTADIIVTEVEGTYRLAPTTVPKGHVYVLGDNRPISLDSRHLGLVPLESISGRAALVFLPLHRSGRVR